MPLHAAINGLADMERAYRHWVALTEQNPEAEVHSNRVYIEMERDEVCRRMLGQRG